MARRLLKSFEVGACSVRPAIVPHETNEPIHPMKLLSLAILATLTTPALAQEVSFTGEIEDVSGTTNQFILDCTGTSLTSSAFNLNQFFDVNVQITGQWNGSATNPSVEVTAITPVPEVFEIGGGAKIGETSNLGFFASPGSQVIGFISTGTGFDPFGSDGVIFLDQNQVVLSMSGTVGGSGNIQMPFQIPNNPSLIGLEIYGQGAVSNAGGFTLTNPDCKEIDS